MVVLRIRRRAGVLTENVASTLDGTALMLSAGAGSVAAGVPLTVMPAPLVAAGDLAMYLESGALRDYLLFVAGALGTGAVMFRSGFGAGSSSGVG